MLNSYRRLPAVIIFVMSDRLMHDNSLLISDTKEILRFLCKQIVQSIESWIDQVPSKAMPSEKTQIYITKPLPKPSAYFVNDLQTQKNFSTIRREYNTVLVAAVKEYGIGFINAGINQEDGQFFKRGKRHNDFALTDKGLVAFWLGVSNALQNLNGLIKTSQPPARHIPEAGEPRDVRSLNNFRGYCNNNKFSGRGQPGANKAKRRIIRNNNEQFIN